MALHLRWPMRLVLAALVALALPAPAAFAARVTTTFTNSTASTFPSTGNASPYGLPITVSGLTGTISDLNVEIDSLKHTNPLDLAFVLVPPAPTQAIDIYDGAGGSHPVNGVTLLLDDEAFTFLPQSAQLASGSYKPAVWFLGTNFPAPGPGTNFCLTGFSTSANCTLAKVDGTDPNGTWTLYAIDVPNGTPGANTSTGSFGGYKLQITTNRAPSAADDAQSVDEDTTLNASVAGLMTDPDSDPLAAQLVSAPAHAASFSFSPSTGSYTYRPAANYNGPDSFTYRASDGTAVSATKTVSITVNPVNDTPTVVGSSKSTPEDTALVVAAPGVLTGASDVDGDPLTAVIDTAPAHGSLALNADGSYTYTPNPNYNGPDSFKFKANDGTTDSTPATVGLNVTAVNDAPTANDSSQSADQDKELDVAAPGVLAGAADVDGDKLTASVVTPPAHGTLALGPDGSYSYTPDPGYSGPDSFTFKANDGSADSAPGTVSLAVNAAPAQAVLGERVTAPRRVSVLISHRNTRLRKGRIAIAVICKGTEGAICKGTLTLLQAPRGSVRAAKEGTYGSAAYSVAAGKTQTIRVKATSSLLKLIAQKRRILAKAVTSLRQEDGSSAEVSLIMTLKRRS